MIRNFKRLSISTMGITLIETAMIMMIVCLIVVGFSTLFSNQVENQGQEFATVTPAREPAYSTAASLKRLKENGPTEYQLELLRKANEEHAKRESDASTKITTAAKAGALAPVDVWVPPGATQMEPTMTSFFQVWHSFPLQSPHDIITTTKTNAITSTNI